jgi:hypothetical protein
MNISGAQVRAYLKATQTDDTEVVDEYVDEFEHGDGVDCWDDFFEHLEDVTADFLLYVENRE